MKKIAVIYASVHHQNTKKLLEGINQVIPINMISLSEIKNTDFSKYDIVGIASGIYMGNLHKGLLKLNRHNCNIPENIFVIYTLGLGLKLYNKKISNNIRKNLKNNGLNVTSIFYCTGYDTFAFLKYFGGIQKGHPDENDISRAVTFIKKLLSGNI